MRVKRAVTSRKKKKKFLKAAKGYRGAMSRRYSLAKEQFYRSGAYAYQGRKKKIMNQEKALYIESIMGLHTADPVSGRFSVQISGRILENGEFTGSFRGMTLAGTIPELLENIDDISSDFKYTGSISGSTMLIKNMSVGGK